MPPEVIQREAWLRDHVDKRKSVTELEILHGVLNNPEMAKHAFFYFRDPHYIEQVSGEQREGFISEEPEIAQRLKELKERIRHSEFPVRENYSDPKALGELVLKDFTGLIESLYPTGAEPNPLDREAADHEAFAQSRARVYIGRQEYFDRLDEHVQSDGPPLVVLGESGSGKSALLANWSAQYREKHPDVFLIQHYIGATPDSADWLAMLRRIMGEFKRRIDIQQDIPDKPDEVRAAFANWLHMAAAKRKVVLILDALNQLEDRDGAPDLVWLPPVIPSNVRLTLSTLPGRALDNLNKRSWPAMEVKPLEPAERNQLIFDYLAQYTKTLSPARVERIAGAAQTANPLYLRVVLEELRVFGVHEQLAERVEHYLNAASIPELYEKVLERYEGDYERDRPELVQDTMKLLWASRRGLSEAELLELLGADKEPLPRAFWSPLYLAVESSLVSRSGLIGLGHEYFRMAVQDKYLAVEKQQRDAHLRLAAHFDGQAIGARKVDELPWQLAEAKTWKELGELLSEQQFFTAAWHANGSDVKTYWAKVETNSPLRMVDFYRSVLAAPAANADHAWRVGGLMGDMGHLEEALALRGRLVAHYREIGDLKSLGSCIGTQALIVSALGRLDEAMRLHKEEEGICRELGNKDGLMISICNQAAILHVQGELDEALRLFKEQEVMCRELTNKEGLAASLGNQAVILRSQGEMDEAKRLEKEQERIYRELGNIDGLQTSLCNQGLILRERGELAEAMQLYKEQERLCRVLGSKNGLRACLSNQALILFDRGELKEAMPLRKEEERLCRELGHREGLQLCLGNQALILKALGDLDGAMRLHKEEERLSRELGNKHGLQVSLGNQALIHKARGDLDGAMSLHKVQERICRELDNKRGLAISLTNQGTLLAEEMARPREGLPLVEEAYLLASDHGLIALANRIKPILDEVRSLAHES